MKIVMALDLGCAEVADLFHSSDLLGGKAIKCAFLELLLIHLVNGERKLDVEGHDASINLGYDAVALAVKQKVNCVASHLGSCESVAKGEGDNRE